jgi:hypothetical protein
VRQLIPVLSYILVCSGCVAAPEPQPMVTSVTSDIAPDDPNCRDYRAQAAGDDQPQEIVGRACRQPDGSWRVSEGPPSAPPQMIAIYVPPPYAYDPYAYDPWLWEFPIGFSLGTSVVFVDRQHHLHHALSVRGLRRFNIANGGGFHSAPMHPAPGGAGHFGTHGG